MSEDARARGAFGYEAELSDGAEAEDKLGGFEGRQRAIRQVDRKRTAATGLAGLPRSRVLSLLQEPERGVLFVLSFVDIEDESVALHREVPTFWVQTCVHGRLGRANGSRQQLEVRPMRLD